MPAKVAAIEAARILSKSAMKRQTCLALTWVLWQSMTPGVGYQGAFIPEWTVLSAYQTKESCQTTVLEYLAGHARAGASPGNRMELNEDGFTVWESQKSGPNFSVSVRYVCLPDTVDPRPRK